MARFAIHKHYPLATVALAVAVLLFLYSGDDQPDQLEKVLQRGTLTMLTRNGASSYYIGPDGQTGPEVNWFASLPPSSGSGWKSRQSMPQASWPACWRTAPGDPIAGNLTRTPGREQRFNFGPDYLETATVVVYRRGKQKPAPVPTWPASRSW